jgi:hypothetical protein
MSLSECSLSYAVQVSAHLAVLPSLYAMARLGDGAMLGCSAATLVTSVLYHLCEVMNNKSCFSGRSNVRLFGMTDGNWHRLDNVFAITSLQLLCLYLSDLPLRKHYKVLLKKAFIVHFLTLREKECVNWLAVFVTLAFQERGPWDMWNTVLPLVPFVVLVFGRLLFSGAGKQVEPRLFGYGVLWLVAAVFCFYKGLDDKRDYLRLWHGCWHVCVTAAASCFSLAKWTVARRQQ